MGTTYQTAGDDLQDVVREVMEKYHSELSGANVTIDVLLGFNEEGIKAGGYTALATIRKISLKDRVKGCGDAEMVIDGYKYEEWTDRQLRALIDHELTHLELVIDKFGKVKRDDIDRPMLSIRLHDRQYGWFDSVARRWGADSFESQMASEMFRDYEFVQLYLPGIEPEEIGTIKKEQLAESIEADNRNGETTPLTSVTFRSSDMPLVKAVARRFRDDGVLS